MRTNLSLNPLVKSWGYELAKEEGYGNNFSAFIADLIRRAREKRHEMQMANKASRELARDVERGALQK